MIFSAFTYDVLCRRGKKNLPTTSVPLRGVLYPDTENRALSYLFKYWAQIQRSPWGDTERAGEEEAGWSHSSSEVSPAQPPSTQTHTAKGTVIQHSHCQGHTVIQHAQQK